jgi:hypothetical protein
VPVYELEKIATIEVGPDNSAARRFRRNYWIARALFTVVILLVAALVVYSAVLSVEFKTAWRVVEVPWAFVTVCILLRMAVLGR